jgi:cytoskeleton protein RodZ
MDEMHEAAGHHGRPAFRPRPDGSIDPAGEAGWFLQRERERRGIALQMAADMLGIHESQLDAIETGDLVRLPTRSEVLAMVAAYGEFLGFEPEPLSQHYSRFLPRPITVAKPRVPAPRPLSSAKIIPFRMALKLAMSNRGLTIVGCIAGAILAFSIMATMLSVEHEQEQVASAIDPLPTASLESEAEDGSAVTVSVAPMSEDLVSAPSSEEGSKHDQPAKFEGGLDDLAPFIAEQLGEEGGEVPKKVRVEEVVPPLPALPEPAGPDEAKGEAPGRVMLKATGTVWFRVEDSRGHVIVSQTLAKGQTYAVPDREDLVIIARDGGLISYAVDGVDKGALGTPGEIVVGRPLSVSQLTGERG